MQKFFLLFLMSAMSAFCPVLAGDKALTFKELMQFRKISGTVISDDGRWVACEARPDRGDGETLVLSSGGENEYSIPRGSGPRIGADGRFVVATILPSLESKEAAGEEKKKGREERQGRERRPQEQHSHPGYGGRIGVDAGRSRIVRSLQRRSLSCVQALQAGRGRE